MNIILNNDEQVVLENISVSELENLKSNLSTWRLRLIKL